MTTVTVEEINNIVDRIIDYGAALVEDHVVDKETADLVAITTAALKVIDTRLETHPEDTKRAIALMMNTLRVMLEPYVDAEQTAH